VNVTLSVPAATAAASVNVIEAVPSAAVVTELRVVLLIDQRLIPETTGFNTTPATGAPNCISYCSCECVR
jgi:hypothetical protein